MASKINISIPKPCHENWHDMTAVEKGRFCNSCQKTVYDFTMLSDKQVIQKINSEPNVCGRFLKSQLDRDLQLPKEKSSIWMAGVSGILSFLSLGNQEVFAQENVKTEQIEGKSGIEKTINASSSSSSSSAAAAASDIEVTGTVTEQNGLPLPGVLVSIIGKPISAQTDLDGKFSIKAKKEDSLEFNYVGYKTKTIIMTSQKNIAIILEDREMYLGGAIIEKQRTFFGRIFHSIGNLFR